MTIVATVATVAVDNDTDGKGGFGRADLTQFLAFCDDHDLGVDLFVA